MRASTRHQLKHDRFAETVTGTAADTFSWVSDHRTRMIIGAVVAVVVVGGAIGGWFYYQQQNDKANLAFGQATRTYQTPIRPAGIPAVPDLPSFASANERSQAARKEFAAIADQYPHTPVGHIARYFVGITYKDVGDYASAEKELKDVVSGGNKDVAALAKYALASIYAATNRNAEAVKEYKDLIDHPTDSVAKSTAQLELAALYEQIQQPAEAAKVYAELTKDDPKGPVAQFAQSKLTALNHPANR